MRQIHFFALQDDLKTILEVVESKFDLQYIRMGQFPMAHVNSVSSGTDLPGLGAATANSSVNSETFLVSESSKAIRVRRIVTNAGSTVFCFDQLNNPDTITFTPGCKWDDTCVIAGRIATASASPASFNLMNAFGAAIKIEFQKIKAFYVGTHALVSLRAGGRLTQSSSTSEKFDLTES